MAGVIAAPGPPPAAQVRPAPTLLVLVVVDQMRADYLARFDKRFTGGFRRLLDQGAIFEQTFYPYLNTVTCAGHATLGTGAWPKTHGIILNEWYRRDLGRVVVHRRCRRTTPVQYVGDGRERGPQRRRAAACRRWPSGCAPAGRSRASVSLAVKPRSAVMMAGKGATAVTWVGDRPAGRPRPRFAERPVPEVVQALGTAAVRRNRERRVGASPRRAGLRPAPTPASASGRRPGWSDAFPPSVDQPGAPARVPRVVADAAPTSDRAVCGRSPPTLVRAIQLGQRDVVDFLGVSFPAVDKVGHDFGPDSHELQDTLLRLDARSARCSTALDAMVGRDRYALALSADHGVAPVPEARRAARRRLAAASRSRRLPPRSEAALVAAGLVPDRMSRASSTRSSISPRRPEPRSPPSIATAPPLRCARCQGFEPRCGRRPSRRSTALGSGACQAIKAELRARRSGDFTPAPAPYWIFVPGRIGRRQRARRTGRRQRLRPARAARVPRAPIPGGTHRRPRPLPPTRHRRSPPRFGTGVAGVEGRVLTGALREVGAQIRRAGRRRGPVVMSTPAPPVRSGTALPCGWTRAVLGLAGGLAARPGRASEPRRIAPAWCQRAWHCPASIAAWPSTDAPVTRSSGRSRAPATRLAPDTTVATLYARDSVIVKFKDGAEPRPGTATMRAAASAPWASRRGPTSNWWRSRPGPIPSEWPASWPSSRTSSTRRRDTAITRCSAPTIRSTPASGTFRRSTWSGPGTSTPAAGADVIVAVLDSGVAFRDALIRFEHGPPSSLELDGPIYPGARASIDVPFAVAPDLGDASRFVSPRDFIWDDDLPLDLDGHGTHVAGTIGQSTNNGVGVAGMAFNVRIMPVKVIDERVGRHLRQSQRRHRRRRRARHPLRRRQRRERDQHEHRPRRPADRRRRSKTAIQYAVSRGVFVADRRRQRRSTAATAEPHRRGRAAHRRHGGGRRRSAAIARPRLLLDHRTPTSRSRRPAAISGASAATGGILQQTVDQDLSHTYELGPALFRAPRFDAFALLLLPGHVDGDAARLGVRGAAVQQGITQPGGDRGGDEAFATDLGRTGRDNEYGARPHQPARGASRPRAGAMSAARGLVSVAILPAVAAVPAARRGTDRARAAEPARASAWPGS